MIGRAARVLAACFVPALLVALLSSHGGAATPEGSPAAPPSYDVRYDVRIVPTERVARVTMRVERNPGLLQVVRMRIDPQRHFRFEGDGEVQVEDDRVTWRLPRDTGELRYSVRLEHLHDSVGYDARCTDKWALFRGEDLVPPTSSEEHPTARARATLRMRVPVGWQLETPFVASDDGTFAIDQPHRRLDRPTGWMLAGKLDKTVEKIAGVSVTIAAPAGQGLRRLDVLALLRWTLPALAKIVPRLPSRLLIVGANDPMWRGGLSGPSSLYLHSALPLISSDGTSTLLHELMHVVTSAKSTGDGDWIVEGLAELYSLQLLLRSGTIGEERYERSLGKLAERGEKAGRLRTGRASGEVTARAVGVLIAVDEEIRRRSDGRHGLDDVVAALAVERVKISTDSFRELVEKVTGVDVGDLLRRDA
jgi:hypothetical protein